MQPCTRTIVVESLLLCITERDIVKARENGTSVILIEGWDSDGSVVVKKIIGVDPLISALLSKGVPQSFWYESTHKFDWQLRSCINFDISHLLKARSTIIGFLGEFGLVFDHLENRRVPSLAREASI